jgi:hypothetical protein
VKFPLLFYDENYPYACLNCPFSPNRKNIKGDIKIFNRTPIHANLEDVAFFKKPPALL